jgi:flavin reductase (DIM6/NTAB) family NADH-FMN oxidoreductase RutF
MDKVFEVPESPLRPQDFWPALSHRAVGAAIVAAQDENGPAGFLALSATHVCANPPTMLVSIGHRTSALATVIGSGHFSINYLADTDREMMDVFAGKTELAGAQRFHEGRWGKHVTGAPVLLGAVAAFDCLVEEIIERHETSIVLGRIMGVLLGDASFRPLVTYRGGVI